MTLLEDWLERADWSRRSDELGELREVRDAYGEALVSMEIVAPSASGVVFERLRQLWLGLPKHPNVLEPIRENDGGRRLLRYAPIDWTCLPIELTGDLRAARLATLGVDLVRTYEFLLAAVSNNLLAWFSCPLGWIDVRGDVRLAFLAAKRDPTLVMRLPPEVIDQWPQCDERGLVYVVGRLLRDWVALDDRSQDHPVCQVIQRCISENPADRFTSLTELLDALVAAGGRRKAPHDWRSTWTAWACVETGLGHLALAPSTNAVSWFDLAVKHDKVSRTSRRSKQGPTAQTLLLRQLRDDVRNLVMANAPAAPVEIEKPSLADGRAQLARGKALWAQGRVREAREAFERASANGPQMLTAMHLRRELDRALANVRAAVGVADASRFVLPEHLAELRDVLIDGHTTDAVKVLSGSEYRSDAVAQLLLAGLLMFERRHAEALAVYDRVLALDDKHQHAALLGKADALLQLGRTGEPSWVR